MYFTFLIYIKLFFIIVSRIKRPGTYYILYNIYYVNIIRYT